MRTSIITILLVLSSLFSFAQYKNDNVLYKTVYMEDLCNQLKSTPNAILLDVRSLGEYEDTSMHSSMNMGRIKGTQHIDIRELPMKWRELSQYKDKPVYVICSHSQRSRRASRLLADSGFQNITNINGGLTMFNLLSISQECGNLYETSNRYTILSPLKLCTFLTMNPNTFILDVRKDSAFRAISADEKFNSEGELKGAVNIPFDELSTSIGKIPTNRSILIVDEFGNESGSAANMLIDKGYKNIYILFDGYDMLTSVDKKDLPCLQNVWNNSISYSLISGSEFVNLANNTADIKIIDVRPNEEFNNHSTTTWRNTGNIKGAINIPYSELSSRIEATGIRKDQAVVVYHFSGATDAYKSAKLLADKGYKKVYVLTGGLFDLRWEAANMKGKSYLKDWVVNIPQDNL